MEEMTGSHVPEMFQLCHEKERIEAELSKNIYTIFNSGSVLPNLQKVASVILQVMGNGDFGCFTRACGEEKDLRVFKKIEPIQSQFILHGSSPVFLKRLDATDVADIIRLVGAWVEHGGGGVRGGLAGEKEARRCGALGGNSQNVWKQPDKRGPEQQQLDTKAFGGAGTGEETRYQRARTNKPWRVEPHLKEFMRDPKGFSGIGGVVLENGKWVGGKRIASGTNLSIINRLFGLSWGCDISGTTCDQVFALEKWGRRAAILEHDAYMLLPLGAIVHNMHHTLLEVALPLSMNGVIDYRIGFFDTLIPRQGLPVELNRIQGLVEAANSKMRDKHLLRYYSNGRPVGCFRFNQTEISRLKKAKISHAETLLKLVSTGQIKVYPSRKDVEKLIKKYFKS